MSQASEEHQTEIQTQEVEIKKIERDHAIDLEQAIVLSESNGKPNCGDMPGLSGEKGCHQFMPSTWRLYSKDVLGYVAKQTPENATIVARGKIRQWIDQGYTDTEIFLIWNQGNRSPCKAGINRKGVQFDSCAYVAKATKYFKIVINNG